MLELRTCARCGVRSQVLDLGEPRCFACGQVLSDQPPPDADTYRVVGGPPVTEENPPGSRALCPRCHRPSSLRERECGTCGYQFGEGIAPRSRRDAVPHRGPLIDRLGAAALIAGASAVLTGPVGLTAALVLGGVACWMAAEDLPRMPTGEVDAAGKRRTEMGRLTGGLGIGLGFVLAAAWSSYWLIRLG